MFHEATVFQYDYLNDDIDRVIGQDTTIGWKMPQELVDDLSNPDLHWIIFINPPFGTAQNKKDSANSKEGISMTKVQKHMHKDKLGEASREVFTQFLYRIHHEFKYKMAHLGLFAKLKFVNSNNDQKLRESIFRYRFEKGFIFDARVFDTVNGPYPIGFLIWDLSQILKDFGNQEINVDISNKKGESYGTKNLKILNRNLLLNKWVNRPKTDSIFPAFSSALEVVKERKDLRDRINTKMICSLCAKGDDFQNQKYIALFSGPYCSAGAYSVTKREFLEVHDYTCS
jgi:hypothetical protein